MSGLRAGGELVLEFTHLARLAAFNRYQFPPSKSAKHELSGEADDPGEQDDPAFLWEVDADNGQAVPDGNDPQFDFTPEDDGTYTVTLTVTDKDGASDSEQFVITVNNRPPVVDLGPDREVAEGDLVSLQSAGAVFDAGTADTHTLIWQVFSTTGQSIPKGTDADFSFTPEDDGIYVVRLTVTDDEGLSGMDDLLIVSRNSAPRDLLLVGGLTIDEGGLFTFSGSFVDGAADHWRARVDFGDGTVVPLPLDGLTFGGSHLYTDGGVFELIVTVTDDDGGEASESLMVTVNNVAPAVNAGDAASIDLVETFERRIFITDPGSGPWDITVDWGDGSPDDVLQTDSKIVDLRHVYVTPGDFTVNVTASDKSSAAGNDSFAASVADIPVIDVSLSITDPLGLPLSQVFVGEAIRIHVFGRDLRTTGEDLGVAGAFLDVLYDTSLIDVTGIRHNGPFTAITSGTVDDVAGRIDEVGGASDGSQQTSRFAQLLFVLDAVATGSGVLIVSTVAAQNPASDVTLVGLDADLRSHTRFGAVNLQIISDNQPPTVSAIDDPVTADEGQTATNTGVFSDPDADDVTITASIGAITQGVGTWSWSFDTNDGPDESGTVTITATDSDNAVSITTFALVVDNVAPSVASDNATVTVDEGQTAVNSGTFFDPGVDVVTITATVGRITQDAGTWSWSVDTGDGPVASQTVTITATDSDNAEISTRFELVVNTTPVVFADLTGDGFVDFNDLTLLLAKWNQFVTVAEGNLVDELTSPVNFNDLTVLLANWTGPGPVGAPQQRAEGGAAEASDPSGTDGADRLRATNELFGRVGRADPLHRRILRTANRRSVRQDSSGLNGSSLRRLQATAVDRAMGEETVRDQGLLTRRRA